MILQTSKGGIGRGKLSEVAEWNLLKIITVVICTSRVVKMKEHPPFWREFNIFCIEDIDVFDLVV